MPGTGRALTELETVRARPVPEEFVDACIKRPEIVQRVDHVVKRVGISGHLVEQTEVGVEDASHLHDEHHDDHVLHQGQSYVADLLPVLPVLGGGDRAGMGILKL